jgi:hypothetical protein
MARLVEEIILKIGVDTGGLENDVAKADDAFEDLENSVSDYDQTAQESSETSKELGGSIDGVKVAAGAAVIALGALIAKSIESQTETIQMANRLGVAAQQLKNLEVVGRQFGASAEDVGQGIKNINESLSEAFAEGQGTKFELFKEMNLDLEKFNQLSPDQQFIEFSKAINEVEDQGRRTAIQLALMGEEGFKLSTTMTELAENSRALSDAQELGGELNEEQIKEINKQYQQTMIMLQRIVNEVTDGLIPAMKSVMEIVNFTAKGIRNVSTEIGFLIEGTSTWAERSKELRDWMEKLNREGAKERKQRAIEQAQAAEDENNAIVRQMELDAQFNRERHKRFLKDKERRKFEEEQKMALMKKANRAQESERKKQEARAAAAEARKQKTLERNLQRQLEMGKSVTRQRLMARLAELRGEEATSGQGISAIEAGSAEAIRMSIERQSIDVGRRRQIAAIENKLAEEEKKIQEEQLKAAQSAAKSLSDMQKNKVVVKTKKLNG